MILTLIISILTCLLLILSVLFFPKIKIYKLHDHNVYLKISTYVIICLLGAILIILVGSISIKEVWASLTNDSSVNPIKILILFFSMTFLSIYLDEMGFFKYLAYKSLKLASNSQKFLFFILYGLVSILTVFTSNDIVILTFTPFICYFCKNAKINPIPYLVAEFAGANTWSMLLIIGNPTNIYLATSYGINFIEYLKVMALPTICAGIVEIGILYLLFRKLLKQSLSLDFKEEHINDKTNLVIGLLALGLCLVFLVISSYINIDMTYISLIFALLLLVSVIISNLLRKKKLRDLRSTFKRLPYELIPFVISMFVIVSALNKQGITTYISELFGEKYNIIKYGYSSFLMANLINNIPMSVLYSAIPNLSIKALYASIIGSNIGAFLTPIGALAGIMFTSLLSAYDVEYGFKKFIKYGLIISIPTITTAFLILSLVL